MLFPLDVPPATATALSALVSASIGLRAVGDAFEALTVETQSAADAADWQSPTARRFHERADDLRRQWGELRSRAEGVAHDVVAVRTRLIVAAPPGLVP